MKASVGVNEIGDVAVFTCRHCSQVFTDAELFRSHLVWHFTTLLCDICSVSTFSFSFSVIHILMFSDWPIKLQIPSFNMSHYFSTVQLQLQSYLSKILKLLINLGLSSHRQVNNSP